MGRLRVALGLLFQRVVRRLLEGHRPAFGARVGKCGFTQLSLGAGPGVLKMQALGRVPIRCAGLQPRLRRAQQPRSSPRLPGGGGDPCHPQQSVRTETDWPDRARQRQLLLEETLRSLVITLKVREIPQIVKGNCEAGLIA